MRPSIPYVFLTGFLGSGKTTMLNGLLKRYGDRKIGVIVNDFGDLAVDASLIEGQGLAGEIRELKAGQIFCSCLAGSFVKSVLAYEKIAPDLILVECSGLAKPSSLKDITRAISLEAPGVFAYGGMVCLIDGQRHLILEKSLMVLKEQMAVSDIFLVSKTDLLDKKSTQILINHIKASYPDRSIIEAPLGNFSEDLLKILKEKNDSYRSVESEDFAGWGEKGRPLTFVIHPGVELAREIQAKLTPFLGRLYRIKGVLDTTDRGRVFFDGTGAGIEQKEAPDGTNPGLVVITHDSQLENDMKGIL
jgi:G3E family GTPase